MIDYPEDFKEAVTDLIDKWEGGYVDDPSDPGGETKFGISKKSYPDLDIAHLTRDDAVGIYYRDYWQKYQLDSKVPDPQMRAKVFNMGVVMGMLTALALAFGCNNVTEYRLVCKRHFEAIVIKHPQDARYLQGWTRRAMA